MTKLPYLPLYTGDWLKDPDLSMCSPLTRGIWIDILCAMHEKDRSGEIIGNLNQIARLCRCSIDELQIALDELKTTNTADVTISNNIVTVMNRRMKRELKFRELTRIRVKRFRSKSDDSNADVTPEKRAVTEIDIENEDEIKSENKKGDIQGEGKEPNYPAMFESFWKVYPKKVGKGGAFNAWKKLDPSANLIDKMIESIKIQSQSVQWQKESGQFIPNCSTWINQARWDDELPIDTGESELSKKNRKAIEEFKRRYENK